MAEAPPAARSAETLQQKVVRFAREVEQLATSGLAPEEFFPKFLERVVLAVSAPAGAIWLVQRGQLKLGYEMKLNVVGLSAALADQPAHRRLLSDIASNIQTRAVHTDDQPDLSLPGRHLLILSAVQAGGSCQAIIEIFQRADVPIPARGGYLQFVEQMGGYASLFLERGRTAAAAPPPATGFSEPLARFGLQLQRSLHVTDVANVAANEGRSLVGCDRVSVLIQRGRKVSVVAVSGQESIHPRSNLIRSMVNLSREVIKSGLPLKYTGSMDSFSPQVEERLADFVQESGARLVFAVPLRESAPLDFSAPANHRPPPPGRVFGCLLLEQFSQSDPAPELVKQLDWLTAYCSAALHSARTHQALFLMPVWRLLGKGTDWLHGRKLIKTSIAVAVIAALVAAMVLIRVDFRIEGEGRLMPVVKREIFVPLDSEVVEVLVASGQRVTAGQLLVRLRSNELRTDLIAAQSQFQEKQKLLAALLAERDEAIRGQLGERTYRIEGDLAKTRVELQGLELQLTVLEERDNLLNVTSPIAGVVSTFDVDQLLRHRPVRRGEILLEVMDETGPWQLELEVPEQRMGHLLSAKQAADNPLPIEFLLVTSPERTYEGTLKEVATRSVISPDGTPVVEIQANLPDDQELTRRIGAEVRAKVQCGRGSLGYVLFGDVVEFFQRNLWL